MASCYRCGSHTFFENSLCTSCEYKEREVQSALKRTADAAEASMHVAADAAAAQEAQLELLQQQAEQRAEKARQKRQMKFVKSFVDCPASLKQGLDEASESLGELQKVLTLLSDRWNCSLGTWLEHREYQPHSFDLAYQEVRALLVPAIRRVWNGRRTLSPPPDESLRSLAATFIYPNLKAASAIMDTFEQAKEKTRQKQGEASRKEQVAREKEEACKELRSLGAKAIAVAVCISLVSWLFFSWLMWIIAVAVLGSAATYAYLYCDRTAAQGEAGVDPIRIKAQSLRDEAAKENTDHQKAAESALARLRDPSLVAIVGK